MLADSLQGLPELRRHNPSKTFDLFYVDGGHSYMHAMTDTQNCARLASAGALVCVCLCLSVCLPAGRPAGRPACVCMCVRAHVRMHGRYWGSGGHDTVRGSEIYCSLLMARTGAWMR